MPYALIGVFLWLAVRGLIWLFTSEEGKQIIGRHGALRQRGKVAGHDGPDAFSFAGRAGRREWWLRIVSNGVIALIVSTIPTYGPLLCLPWVLAIIAVSSRRAHDINLSAWLQLVPPAIAAVCLGSIALMLRFGVLADSGPTFDWTNPSEAIASLLLILPAIVLLGFVLWFGLRPGARGPNAYGEADPV